MSTADFGPFNGLMSKDPYIRRYRQLHLSLARGRDDEAVKWLNEGADYTVTDGIGFTALHMAAKAGCIKTVSLMCKMGLGRQFIDQPTKTFGRTALQLAVEHGNHAIVKILHSAGADINARDFDGNTVFHVAAARGNKDMISLLVRLGADMWPTNNKDQTPLDIARNHMNYDFVDIMLQHISFRNASRVKRGKLAAKRINRPMCRHSKRRKTLGRAGF